MLINRSKKGKSVSCLHLQKEITKSYPSQSIPKRSQSQFIPFTSQRKLGKLISDHSSASTAKKPSNEQLIERLNFHNFGTIYKMLNRIENRKYSELTRSSGQKDVINHEWKLNNLSKLPSQNLTKSINRDAPSPLAKTRQKRDQFQKMNKYLFTKLSKVSDPTNNPEMHELYSNYIRISELNENLKREELTGKSKAMPFS